MRPPHFWRGASRMSASDTFRVTLFVAAAAVGVAPPDLLAAGPPAASPSEATLAPSAGPPPPGNSAPQPPAAPSREEAAAAVLYAIGLARSHVQTGIPFRLDARLDVLDGIGAAVDGGAVSAGAALHSLVSFLDHEVSRAGSNESAHQLVDLGAGMESCDVVRLGTVDLFARSRGGAYGRAVAREGRWEFEALADPAVTAALADLFDQFRQGIRTGFRQVPTAASPRAPTAAPSEVPPLTLDTTAPSLAMDGPERDAWNAALVHLRTSLGAWGVRWKEGSSEVASVSDALQRGLAAIANAGRVSASPGTFLLPDGEPVRGDLLRYGLVAASGVAAAGAGPLVPLDGGRLQMVPADPRAATDAWAAGTPGLLTPLVLLEPLGGPPQDLPQQAPTAADSRAAAAAQGGTAISIVDTKAEQVEVTATRVSARTAALLEERQESAAIAELLGAEQMTRSGDTNAADSLRRATGLTLVGGQFVYIRGLGERYVSARLDSSALPSPDPERRVVPLDLFPAGVIESMLVTKSYLPDLPGEFGGGDVRIRTLSFPEPRRFSVSANLGVRVGTTFASGLTYAGGSLDWLGADDGSRALPSNVAAASEAEPLLESDMFSDRGYTAEELEAFGESLPNTWATSRSTVLPNGSVALSGGGLVRLGERERLGIVFAAGYGKSFQRLLEHRTYYNLGAGSVLEPFHEYDFESLNDRTGVGGVLGLSLSPVETHTIRSRTFVTRVTDDETRLYGGFNRDAGTEIEVTRLRFVERTLFAEEVSGHHVLPLLGSLVADWRLSYSKALRHEPDTREYRYDHEGLDEDTGADLWFLSDRPEGNQRLYSDLDDDHLDAGLDADLLMPAWRGQFVTLSAGGGLVWRDREVDTRRFKFQHKGGASRDPDVLSQRNPEDIFTPDNIGPGNFQLEEFTQKTDNYTASQRVGSAYLMADVPFDDRARLVGGARVERSVERVTTFELFNPDGVPVDAGLDDTEVLFGVDLVFRPRREMNVRLAGARTVNRPDFRELSPATFNDVTGGRQVFGNPDLKAAILWHADARWEWFPREGELVSLGAFYKRIEHPIEQVIIVSAQQSVTYDNAAKADNVGVELEVRKSFDFVHRRLAPLSIAFNAAWIHSRVTLDAQGGIQTSNVRPLQGQSPYVVNCAIGWDDPRSSTSVNVLYNVFGPRIAEVGADGAPDVYEQPVHQLDVTARQGLGRGFALTAGAHNLVDPVVVTTQGGEIVREYRRGRLFQLGVRWEG